MVVLLLEANTFLLTDYLFFVTKIYLNLIKTMYGVIFLTFKFY